MAITKTTILEFIEVKPAADTSAADTSNEKYPAVMLSILDTIDDAEDDTLPVNNYRTKILTKFVEDGGAATDITGEDALVQSVCGAIWS